MWERFQRITVNRDHAIIVQKSYRPGEWFDVGPGILFILPRSTASVLFVLREQVGFMLGPLVPNDELDTTAWRMPREVNSSLHFLLEVKARNPTGWYFTVPIVLRRKAWLPEGWRRCFL